MSGNEQPFDLTPPEPSISKADADVTDQTSAPQTTSAPLGNDPDESREPISEKALINNIIKSMNREIRFVRCIEQNEAIAQSELEATNFSSIKFQLANGHDVRISIKPYSFYEYGVIRTQYYSVGIFSSDGTLPTTMIEQHAFRIDQVDSHDVIPPLWKWLEDLAASPRRVAEYEDIDDFAESLSDQISILLSAPEDAVEHLDHLPEKTNPEAFDKVDDSIYNDQDDSHP